MKLWMWWASVVLFSAAAAHAVTCPQMCDCQHVSDTRLIVDCKRREVNESILAQELDQQLSDEDLKKHLGSLQITKTPLTQVPISVCHLTNLMVLNLDYNRLSRLPDNCFTGMTSLVSLSAENNNITELQDGLFDGLHSLIQLNFGSNQIASIGLRVFSNESDLVNLQEIFLDHNNLRSLDPWPIIRGLHGRSYSQMAVDLGHNRISHFTNNIHWQFNCSMRSYAILFLWYNDVRRFNDILVGWNLVSPRLFCLFAVVDEVFAFDVRIELGLRNYTCDCQDFRLQAFQRLFVNYDFLNNVVCSAPRRLAGTPALQVPLTQLECELSDHCPSSCRCVYRPANATLHVDCSAANLSSLPLELLPLPKSYDRYKLDFSQNRLLRRLNHRPYFVSTSVLDVSNCAISVVDIDAWREIAKMQSPFVATRVYLHSNKIESLPFEISRIDITSVQLTLNDNPWECSCENHWMIDWFKSVSSSTIADVRCASPSRLEGRSIVQSTKDDFCVDPSIRMLKISLSFTLTPAAVLLIFGFSVYRLRVRLFMRWKFHPFDRDECAGEDMDYDVFLCCSSDDDDPHGLRILTEMELNGYRVYYHERDFLPGELITDNIVTGVTRSKRTVCLLSNNFLRRYTTYFLWIPIS